MNITKEIKVGDKVESMVFANFTAKVIEVSEKVKLQFTKQEVKRFFRNEYGKDSEEYNEMLESIKKGELDFLIGVLTKEDFDLYYCKR